MERVALNVGGERFVTYLSTLQRIEGTRLSNLSSALLEYDQAADEYFFDRNPRLFPYVLDVFRTKQIHFPHCLCAPSIKAEMEFWGIPDELISSCCWKAYRQYEEEKETLLQLDNALKRQEGEKARQLLNDKSISWLQRWKTKIWLFLEDPSSSLASKVWSYIFVLLLLASVSILVLETHPSCRVYSDSWKPTVSADVNNTKLLMYITTAVHPASRIINQLCNIIFFGELLLRFIVCPKRSRFLFSFFNVIDILSVIPSFTITMLILFDPYVLVDDLFVSYFAIAISSVFRTIRILKLIKHNQGLRVMMLAIRASGREIMLLFLLMAIGMLIFSTMIYYAEFNVQDENAFPNIPIGFWWSLVTMTTVGYGDMFPRSSFGYLIGSLCAITGMLITGLPIPVIANNFNLYYSCAKLRENMKAGRLVSRARDIGQDEAVVSYAGHMGNSSNATGCNGEDEGTCSQSPQMKDDSYAS